MKNDLKEMMDSKPINEIEQELDEFIKSGDGYENKLKLTFVLLCIIKASTQSLQSVDFKDFISQVRNKVEEVSEEAISISDEYKAHVKQDNEIIGILVGKDDNRIGIIQDEVKTLLKEYDSIIKRLVEIHERLPIEKQLEKEKET